MSKQSLKYGPNEPLPWASNVLMALQLVASALATIVAPPLIIADSLSLSSADAAFLVSASLLCASIGTFVQTKRIGRIGTGLLVIEGANFTFVGVIIAAGLKLIERKVGAGLELELVQKEVLGTIFTGLIIASSVAALFSLLLKYIQKHLSPVVLGTMVALIGLCLLKVGAFAVAGGEDALRNNMFADPRMIITAIAVIVLILFCQFSKIRVLSMAAVLWGLIGGVIIAFFLGIIPEINYQGLPIVSLPHPVAYGFGFDLVFTLNMSLLSILLVFASSGIITASCQSSGVGLDHPDFPKRMRGGVFAQAIDSAIAGVFCGIPLTPYAQMNSIISYSGIGSRKVGYTVAVLFLISSFIPAIAQTFTFVPQAVLGAATLFLFGSIAVSGFEMMLTKTLRMKDVVIIACSLSCALAVEFYPELLSQCPELVKDLFSSGIVTGSCIAILLQFVLPDPKIADPATPQAPADPQIPAPKKTDKQ